MNNRTDPLISVIVPVYNVAPYVEACLSSIVSQSYENLEILVVDDASTDGSYDICQKYHNADSRIRLMQHNKNLGLSAARNTALEVAKGDYIVFVDSDDTIDKNMYSAMCSAAQKNEADIVVCGYYYIDENGKITSSSSLREINITLRGIEKIKYNISTSNNCVWNKLYKRSVFETVRFPLGKTFEDIFIMHRLFDNANQVYLIPERLYNYRQRKTGITLRPFSNTNLDIVEAYLERYTYVTSKYPDSDILIKDAGRHLIDNFLYCFMRAFEENKMEMYSNELKSAADLIRNIDRSKFELPPETENTVSLILKDFRLYILAMKLQKTSIC